MRRLPPALLSTISADRQIDQQNQTPLDQRVVDDLDALVRAIGPQSRTTKPRNENYSHYNGLSYAASYLRNSQCAAVTKNLAQPMWPLLKI